MPRTVLIVATNPTSTGRLRLDEEVREIEEGLRRARKRDEFVIRQHWAARPEDLRRAMLDHEPQIVHFSGHGAGKDGIVLEDDRGVAKLVNGEALRSLFELFPNVECVLLNACYSVEQATAIVATVPYVIGMSRAVGDRAAIVFATAFYDALGAGKAVDFAFRFACSALRQEAIPEHLTPVLKVRGTAPPTAASTPRRPSLDALFASMPGLPDARKLLEDTVRSVPTRKIVRAGDLAEPWSSYRLMTIDWHANSFESVDDEVVDHGDGRLTRQALKEYIERLERERASEQGQGLWRRRASFDRVEEIDEELARTRSLLRDMEQAHADAVDHLPRAMEAFPDHLRGLAVEMLMKDDARSAIEITQFVVDNARSRYRRLPERTATEKKRKDDALASIKDPAARLGLY